MNPLKRIITPSTCKLLFSKACWNRDRFYAFLVETIKGCTATGQALNQYVFRGLHMGMKKKKTSRDKGTPETRIKQLQFQYQHTLPSLKFSVTLASQHLFLQTDNSDDAEVDQELNPENDPGANPAQVGQLLSLRFHLGSTVILYRKKVLTIFQYYAHSEQYVTSRYPSQESIDVLEAGRLQVQLTEGKKSHLLMQKTDIYSIASFTANKRSTFQCLKTDSCVSANPQSKIATGRTQNIDQCQLICAAGTKINLLRENSPKGTESVSKPRRTYREERHGLKGFCSPRFVRNEKPCGPEAVQQAIFVFPKLDGTSVMRNLCRMRNSAPQRQTSYSRGAGSCRCLLEMSTSSFWFPPSFDFCSRSFSGTNLVQRSLSPAVRTNAGKKEKVPLGNEALRCAPVPLGNEALWCALLNHTDLHHGVFGSNSALQGLVSFLVVLPGPYGTAASCSASLLTAPNKGQKTLTPQSQQAPKREQNQEENKPARQQGRKIQGEKSPKTTTKSKKGIVVYNSLRFAFQAKAATLTVPPSSTNGERYFKVSLQLLVTKSFHRKHVHNPNTHTSERRAVAQTPWKSACAEGCPTAAIPQDTGSRSEHLFPLRSEESRQPPAPDVTAVQAGRNVSSTHSSRTRTRTCMQIHERDIKKKKSSCLPLGIKQCKVGDELLSDKADLRKAGAANVHLTRVCFLSLGLQNLQNKVTCNCTEGNWREKNKTRRRQQQQH
ncbi:hypothetical protein Anapl_12592 [Anas platyrhynchos]|uniref:Uncharacterized protein n=1 Tax=Anas platyrhynchos TaxID=8839 RepID=R0JKL1_ANAPL|nr:hypothetical protein Anapl_12592 [Anas platyrhynchos]